MSNADFDQITLVSVTGLADASGAARALEHSQAQMEGCKAVLCSPQAPHALAPGITHVRIAPMNYHEYSWFMMFALWRVVSTEFALVVQEDGWVVDGANWRSEFLDYDYVGAPIHQARVIGLHGVEWRTGFEWSHDMGQPDRIVVPVQNGGFSLRSRRLMRALVDHAHIRVEVAPPDDVAGDPLQMHWRHWTLFEDVQLSGVLRPALEATGVRFAPLELARSFSIEHAGVALHQGYNALELFGHHAKTRRLANLAPLTLRCSVPLSQAEQWYGEVDILHMFERRGYAVEFAPSPASLSAATTPARPRKVYDCFTYNGEADVLAIRLHELSEVVDCFVIVEADRTFSGAVKPLAFDAADPRIAPFAQRIRYLPVRDMPDGGALDAPLVGDWLQATPQTGHWIREKYQRNQIVRGLDDAEPDSLILVSDIDEIPRAEVVRQMRDDEAHQVFGLQLAFYYFYANYRNVEGPETASIWTVAAIKAQLDRSTPDRLRIEVRSGVQPAHVLANAGWHLSYLGMDDDAVRHKIATFAHQEYNTPELLDAIDLQALTASGRDLYDRAGYAWQLVAASEAPRWMQSQPALAHLFLATAGSRYAKESYLAADASPHGFWEGHANRCILQAYAPFIRGVVADLGCNHGATTYWLTENPAVSGIVGVDVNAQAVALAQALFETVRLPSRFVCQDLVRDADFAGRQVDTLVSFHTLEHIYPEDVQPFLRTAFDAVVPGGHFVVSIPYDRAYPDPCHVAFYSETTLARAMEAAGFQTVECFRDDRFEQKDLLTGLFVKPGSARAAVDAQFAAVPARYKELSGNAGLDDERAKPSDRLLDFAADAFRRARTLDLAVFARRRSAEPRWFETWPGEHYRLLAAMVDALQPLTVVEIGTFTGMGTLSLLQCLPAGAKLVTFDLLPWNGFADTWLEPEDFAGERLKQVLADLSTDVGIAPHRALLETTDFIFVDGPKDGRMEANLLLQLGALNLRRDPIVFFDDIRVINMVATWRRIDRPKMDITSLGHWSGSGLVDWNG